MNKLNDNYEVPVLQVIGSLAELTQAGGTNLNQDNPDPQTFTSTA